MLANYLLPVTGGYLRPCSVAASELTPVSGGHHCASCQRVVHDFTNATAAEVAAARTASPDGRLCGRFRVNSAAGVPTLTRRLRWFVVALVLVVGQGLTAREALAQMRKPVPHKSTTAYKKHVSAARRQVKEEHPPQKQEFELSGEMPMSYEEVEVKPPVKTGNEVYGYVEQMPQLPGGGGMQQIVAYIQQHIQWPQALSRTEVEGKVFATFIVGDDGLVREARIIKGLHPLLDAEALRVIRALPTFTPGRQNGKTVPVSFAVPITFRR